MTSPRRKALLGSLLAITLALSAWTLLRGGGEDEGVVAPARRTAVPAPGGSKPAPSQPSSPDPAARGSATTPAPEGGSRSSGHVDVFRAYSYEPPRPRVPAAPTAVVQPNAPPPQLAYTGRIFVGEQVIYLFLRGGVEPVRLSEGDVSGEYRFLGVDSSGFTFEYLPTKQEVSLPLPGNWQENP